MEFKNGTITKVEKREGEYNGNHWEKVIIHCLYDDNSVEQIQVKELELQKMTGKSNIKELEGIKYQISAYQQYQNNKLRTLLLLGKPQ